MSIGAPQASAAALDEVRVILRELGFHHASVAIETRPEENDDRKIKTPEGLGERPAATEFSKDEERIPQGAIVANKLLAGALHHIKQEQKKRDAEKLRRLRTMRDKRLLLRRVEASA